MIISTIFFYSKGIEGRELKLVSSLLIPSLLFPCYKKNCGYNHFFILLFHGVGENKSFICSSSITIRVDVLKSDILTCSFSAIQFSISSASLENCCNVCDSPSLDLFSMSASLRCCQRLSTSARLPLMSSLA